MDRNEYLQLADWRRRTALIYARWRDEAAQDPEAATMRLRQARGDLFHTHPQSPLPFEGRSRFRGLSYYSYDPTYRMRARLEAAEESGDTSAVVPAVPAAKREETQPVAASAGAGAGASRGGFSLSSAYRSAAAMPGLHWPISLKAPETGDDFPPIELPASGEEPFSFRRIGLVRLSGPLAGETLSVFWMEGYAGGLFLPFRDATSGNETYGAGRYLLDTAKGADPGVDAQSGELLLDFNLAYQPSCAYDPRWNCPLAPPENRLGQPVRAGERL
jgi:uncharacterized protein (DUF1684 family)